MVNGMYMQILGVNFTDSISPVATNSGMRVTFAFDTYHLNGIDNTC